ncbi:hypothetical protein ABT269_22420 [Streptomyces viridosporus]|uniref:hypothetical protein n=1 Tax=Streptomyces viridosporus TaxID=67581 RepID=UPI00332AA67F
MSRTAPARPSEPEEYTRSFPVPLVTGTGLPDYLNAPAAHHGALPNCERSARARALVARALSVLTDNGQPLAAYTATGHCISEGAHVDSQTLGDRVNVMVELELTHFDGRLNPRHHPGYPALRAARIAQATRWADLFAARGWQVQAVHGTTPGRLGFVLTPPATGTAEPARPTAP